MQIDTRQGPSFGVARVTLGGNEQVRVEAGAMMAMGAGVMLEAKAEGGVMQSLKRAALGGESFFINTYTAPEQGGFVDLAARLPGDVTSFDKDPNVGLFIQKGSWLASPSSISIDTKWGGFKNLFGSEGGFILRADGSGPIAIAAYGALEIWDLAPGQHVTLDTGHMVAYEETVQMEMRKATGGMVQTFKSGEGLVFDFTGPGKLMVQTRNPNELLGWIAAAVGGSGGSGNAGVDVVSGLLGRN